MGDVTEWIASSGADPACECCLGDGLQADGETPCPCVREGAMRTGPRHHYRVGFAAGRAAAIREMTVAQAARVIIEAQGSGDAAVFDAVALTAARLDDDEDVAEGVRDIFTEVLAVLAGVE